MMSLGQIILAVPAILLAISVHEYGHAFVAYKLGDPTPKYQGRLSLNPMAHLDPLGTIMLLLFRVGWARPVMINSHYFKNKRQGTIFVSLAGPAANLITAWIFYNIVGVFGHLMLRSAAGQSLIMFFYVNVQVNLGLAAFNLIPIPPLDGSHILAGLLPSRLSYEYSKLAPYGPFVLIALLVLGGSRYLVNPIFDLLFKILDRLSL
ncbi:MAG TPA: site-2 protease family protein [Firmicutes bacterium]|jgi:Zn-dependent protease|nr:site-2 protease family protein [Bacillota bacterium]